MDDFDDFIKEICERNGWDISNETLCKNCKSYLKAEYKFDIDRNYKLLDNKNVMHYENFPTGRVETGLLISYWQQAKTNLEVAKVSGQAAGMARTLRRDRGFTFKKGENKNWEFKREDGKMARMIIGLDPSSEEVRPRWNCLNQEEQKIIKSIFNKDIMGIRCKVRNGEIDHRIPEITRHEEGIKVIPLTRKSLLDGTWNDTYQILSKTTNNRKREACIKCQDGLSIELPPCVELMKSAYKKEYIEKENQKNKCLGCFWFNPLKPKYPEKVPDLEFAIEEQNKKLEKIKEKLKQKEKKKRKK